MNFGKVLTAMVTPFDKKGNIDFDTTTTLIDYLLDNGSDGLVVAGTTGESPTLSTDEKISLWKHVVNVVGGRVPVIAGSGSNDTRASVELSKQAEQIGVDAVMVVAPYYNKPCQKGLYEHFKAVAGAVGIPVMIYNVPGRAVVKIEPETIIALSNIPNIVSVKEATGDLDSMAAIISKTDDGFSLYSGDDNLTLPSYTIGASGIISVSSHVVGKEMQKMLTLHEQGKRKEAAELHQKLLPIFNGMFSAPSPTPVKEALRIRGIDTGSVRLPLIPLNPDQQNDVRNLFQSL
ncbi:4-hydroxy-tetrahydrodipicolinate synthase [Halobacillus yeomjeoni]|uniref:4-hydroxy-tetrahydrodipicolinate synthase n=1 Tax=Halobacillus yeomjeoni TaxID=311194 RepID=A0A931HTW6_9BACI|nr:4-hydroxy-tetrahydrodipicolinate synthase [Halobacillus yeomjeoni]MBH0229328.1 4-hydroxy-tetrahydrodipicolinate synthase [Halobacillus yeomjeoni]